MANIRYLVQTGGTGQVYLYRNSSQDSAQFSTLPSDSQVIVTQISEDGNWYYVPRNKAWIPTSSVTLITRSPSASILDNSIIKVGQTSVSYASVEAQTAAYTPTWARPLAALEPGTTNNAVRNTGSSVRDINTNGFKDGTKIAAGSGSSSGSILVSHNTNGIFGIPYQFSPLVDRRLNNSDSVSNESIGRKYAEKIMTRDNILHLIPCVQKLREDGSRPSHGFGRYVRYYNAEPASAPYFSYVDSMCRATAVYMGIGDKTVTIGKETGKLASFRWSRTVNTDLQSYQNSGNNVTFYVDGLSSISEDFSNDTRESSLASTVNGMADEAKELNFLLKTDLTRNKGVVMEKLTEGIASLGDFVDSGQGVIASIMNNVDTLLSGGKLAFPEMWSDSGHDMSYSINFKFRTPEADPLSIYLNIIVPYIHLLAFTAPHDFIGERDNVQGYVEPFLIRAMFKGLFSIDMGLVTSLSCDRGAEGTWSLQGLPTQLDVSMTIKDLYHSFFISTADGTDARGHSGSAARFIGNDGLTDHLMAIAGVDMAKPLLDRQIAAYGAMIGNKFNPSNAFVRWGNRMKDQYASIMDRIFR